MLPDANPTRLPDLMLPAAPDGSPMSLRARRRENSAVTLLHSPDCAECLEYVERLAGVQEQLRDWDGRVIVVVPGNLAGACAARERLQAPFSILADPDGTCAARCDLGGGSMIIADQWGEVFHVHPGAPGRHDFPAPEEVVEWLRFVAIQCPECQGEAW